VPILYVLIPVIPAKFCRYLPVLKSPEYRKTGFGIAGIGNTNRYSFSGKGCSYLRYQISVTKVKVL
jgi:hypothetical protein